MRVYSLAQIIYSVRQEDLVAFLNGLKNQFQTCAVARSDEIITGRLVLGRQSGDVINLDMMDIVRCREIECQCGSRTLIINGLLRAVAGYFALYGYGANSITVCILDLCLTCGGISTYVDCQQRIACHLDPERTTAVERPAVLRAVMRVSAGDGQQLMILRIEVIRTEIIIINLT